MSNDPKSPGYVETEVLGCSECGWNDGVHFLECSKRENTQQYHLYPKFHTPHPPVIDTTEAVERCNSEVFDGWEDTDRCLLDEHGEDVPHNYVNPGDDTKLLERFHQYRLSHPGGELGERCELCDEPLTDEGTHIDGPCTPKRLRRVEVENGAVVYTDGQPIIEDDCETKPEAAPAEAPQCRHCCQTIRKEGQICYGDQTCVAVKPQPESPQAEPIESAPNRVHPSPANQNWETATVGIDESDLVDPVEPQPSSLVDLPVVEGKPIHSMEWIYGLMDIIQQYRAGYEPHYLADSVIEKYQQWPVDGQYRLKEVEKPSSLAGSVGSYDDCSMSDTQAAEQYAIAYVCEVGVSRETMIDAISTLRAQVLSYEAKQSQPVIEPLVSEQLLDELIAPLAFDKQSAGYLAIQELRQFRKAQKDLGK